MRNEKKKFLSICDLSLPSDISKINIQNFMFEVGDVLSRNLFYTCLIDNGTMIIWKTLFLPEKLIFSSSGIEHKTSGTKV